MKKLSVVLVSVALVGVASSAVLAWSGQVPYAAKAPTIDAALGADEWAGALISNIGLDFEAKNGSWSGSGPLADVSWKDKPASAIVHMMWDEKNLYLAGEYTDTNLFFKIDPSGVGNGASAPTNCQDAMQLTFDPLGDAAEMNDLSIIDFTMTPDAKTGMYWQHWGDPRREFPDIKMAAVKTAKGYAFEAAVPWVDFDGYQAKAGDKLNYEGMVLDVDADGTVGIMADGPAMPWADAQGMNNLVLKK